MGLKIFPLEKVKPVSRNGFLVPLPSTILNLRKVYIEGRDFFHDKFIVINEEAFSGS